MVSSSHQGKLPFRSPSPFYGFTPYLVPRKGEEKLNHHSVARPVSHSDTEVWYQRPPLGQLHPGFSASAVGTRQLFGAGC